MSLRSELQDIVSDLINPGTAYALAKSIWRRPELAEKLSGTTDRKSKAYKAALRNLERYDAPSGKQQRKPGTATLEKLAAFEKLDQGAIEQALRLARGSTEVRITFDGEFRVSSDRRKRHIEFRMDYTALAEVLAKLSDPNPEAYYEALWERYGVVPDAIGNEVVRIR